MASLAPDLLPPPETINDTHKVYSAAIACIVLGFVSSACVIVRLAHRFHAWVSGADGYAVGPGLLFYIGWTAMAGYVNLHAGVGKPLWEITEGEFSVWFKVRLSLALPAMSMSIKTSILLLYHRMFAQAMPRLRLFLWLLLAFQVALYSVSMAFDLILFFTRLYSVSKLQMPLRKQIGTAAILALRAGFNGAITTDLVPDPAPDIFPTSSTPILNLIFVLRVTFTRSLWLSLSSLPRCTFTPTNPSTSVS
ncbi:uncharacterized protein BDV17DRAFT_288734 [Aspergillus undulatus]|uniref:uncharacterized protein n=1 Tax=Aspergillus undulatus TaxID=1810928 RepID=UPI003CCDAC00